MQHAASTKLQTASIQQHVAISKQQAASSKQQATSSKQQAANNKQQTANSKQKTTSSKQKKENKKHKTLKNLINKKKNEKKTDPCPLDVNKPWSIYKTGDDKEKNKIIPEGFNL